MSRPGATDCAFLHLHQHGRDIADFSAQPGICHRHLAAAVVDRRPHVGHIHPVAFPNKAEMHAATMRMMTMTSVNCPNTSRAQLTPWSVGSAFRPNCSSRD